MPHSISPAWLLIAVLGCAPAVQAPRPSVDPIQGEGQVAVVPPAPVRVEPQRIAPPEFARENGLMPLEATRVTDHARMFPDADGRGVIIAILDSGIDLSTPGLQMTSTGDTKILDLRDFSGEGRVALEAVRPDGDQVSVGGVRLTGFGRVRALNANGPWYGGTLHELVLGAAPGADLDGNGRNTDTLAVIVTRAMDGWVLFADTNRDGSLADERPLRDYLVARETFAWRMADRPAQITIAVNLSPSAGDGPPVLDFFMDQSSHGTHVAAIAAGRDMFGVRGFDGVAPGAMLLGLKISNNAHGGLSVTGSKLAAMDYAIRFARQRNMPLVMNLSFGVGNEAEGMARIDAIVDSVLAANPDVVMVTSAGNDGPGLSTLGFPASARLPISVGATWPAAFSGEAAPGSDIIAFFSARGGEMAKPEVLAPGFAYATVPAFDTGEEVKNGTSMSSPHVAGIVARLMSARRQAGQPVVAHQLKQALMVTARPFSDVTFVDQGTGTADAVAAHQWLAANRPVEDVVVTVSGSSHTAVWRGDGLRSAADTMARFTIRRPGAASPITYRLRSSAPWLRAAPTAAIGATGEVTVRWDPAALSQPGVYGGVVSGWGADTTAGPAFRLVATIVVPAGAVGETVNQTVSTAAGAGRVFFQADSARSFDVRISSTSPQRVLFGSLFQPGGQPNLGESFIPAGFGQGAGEFAVDARDATRGTWQVSVAPPVGISGSATVEIFHSPVRITPVRGGDSLSVGLHNLTDAAVEGELFAGIVGAERGMALTGRGSETRSVPLRIPSWARRAVIDLTMPAEEWPRFTDFGASLVGADGQIIESEPMNYRTARLAADLEDGADRDAALVLLPGFADPGQDQSWQLAVTVRFYAAEPVLLEIVDGVQEVSIAAGARVTRVLRLTAQPSWVLPDAFAPLGQVAVVVGDRLWSREITFAEPLMAVRP
jgi:subtilisin family serine protease